MQSNRKKRNVSIKKIKKASQDKHYIRLFVIFTEIFNKNNHGKTAFQGAPVSLAGEFIKVGAQAPEFSLVKGDLSSFTQNDIKGKYALLNIFPSMDTGVCATSVRKFNKLAAEMENTVVLAISKDLPFAQGRFCTTEGIENVIPLSDYRYTSDFGEKYGVLMTDGVLCGLLARAVVIINPEGKVIYTELVPEITQEPNYDSALAALKEQR